MSRFEHNKGKLIPFGAMDEDKAKRVSNRELLKWYDNYLEWVSDEPEMFGLCVINDQFYKCEFEVEGGEMIEEFVNVKEIDNGVIEFSIQHYNGGAHWTEVIEGELKKK